MEVTLLFAGVIGIIFIMGSIVFSIKKKRRFSEYLSNTAEKYGITFKKGTTFEFPSVSGIIDFYPILIERFTFSAGNSNVGTLRFMINIKKRKLSPFSISAEGFVSRLKKVFGKKDLQIGDMNFDDNILIRGNDVPQLYGLLNKKARSLIIDLIGAAYEEHFTANENKIEFCILLGKINSEKDIDYFIQKLLHLAKIFFRQGKTIDLIKENYVTEIHSLVRKNLLKTILTLTDSLPPEDPVIKKALISLDPEIEFLGVRLLRKNGYDRIKSLFTGAGTHIKKLILDYLKTEKEVLFLDYFLENAAKETGIGTKKELVDYFRVIGDAKAEPFLRNELKQNRESKVNTESSYILAIIRALKTCGTYESIELLYNIKQSGLKREVDKTISAIQDRIGSGDKGWLSINTRADEAGGLSLTDKQAGDDS